MLTALLIVILIVLIYFAAKLTPSTYELVPQAITIATCAVASLGYLFIANISHHELSRRYSAGSITTGGAVPIGAIIRGTFKQVANLTHLTLSTGATFASLGMGGDTIVDVAFLAIGAAELTARLGMFLHSGSSFIMEILRSGFEGGPDAVADRSRRLLAELAPDARANLFALIRSGMQTLLEVAGTVLSALIPDDGGVFAVGASWLGSIGGAIGTPQWFNGLRGIYNLIPETLRSYVESGTKLQELFHGVLDVLNTTITNASVGLYQSAINAVRTTSWKRMALSALMPMTMAPQVGITIASQFGPTREFIRSRLHDARTHTELAADLVQHTLGLLFAAAYVLQSDNSTVESSNSTVAVASQPITALQPITVDANAQLAGTVPDQQIIVNDQQVIVNDQQAVMPQRIADADTTVAF